jgi:hypothetical protein
MAFTCIGFFLKRYLDDILKKRLFPSLITTLKSRKYVLKKRRFLNKCCMVGKGLF